MLRWLIRTPEGREGLVPSVVFRLPPPDERLLGYLQRLQALIERLRRLWMEKNLHIRFNMILKAARDIRTWDLKYVRKGFLIEHFLLLVIFLRFSVSVFGS